MTNLNALKIVLNPSSIHFLKKNTVPEEKHIKRK